MQRRVSEKIDRQTIPADRRGRAARLMAATLLALAVSAPGWSRSQAANAPAEARHQLQITYVGSTEGWAPISFERYRNEIFFEATINGTKASVMLDNGVDSSMIDTGFAKRAGIRLGAAARSMATGTAEVPGRYADDVRLDIPHHVSVSGPLIARDLEPLATIMGHPIDAVLGGDVVNTMAIGVIGSRHLLYLMPSGKIAPQEKSVTVPLVNGSEVEAAINGKPNRLYVDLGSNGAVDLSNESWLRSIPEGVAVRRGQSTNGEGAIRTELTAANNDVTIGGATAHGVTIGRAGTIPRGSDGLLGNAFLSHFDVVLDVQAGKLVLMPLRQGPVH